MLLNLFENIFQSWSTFFFILFTWKGLREPYFAQYKAWIKTLFNLDKDSVGRKDYSNPCDNTYNFSLACSLIFIIIMLFITSMKTKDHISTNIYFIKLH